MKFFIVSRKNVLLGKEIVKNNIIFTIGKNLRSQENFAQVTKLKNNIFIQSNYKSKNKNINEELVLFLKAIKNNFGANTIFIDSFMFESLWNNVKRKDLKSKYDNLADVYNDPFNVPWNFMSTEIEGILSYFKKNILKNKKILYIGAGYGKNIWALKDNKHNYEIDAIEYSGIAASRANAIFGEKIVNHKDLLSIKDRKQKYDVILDIGCLHSVPDKLQQKAVNIIYDSLKEKGVIISRIFKPRDNEWIKRMPFKISKFGLNMQDINKIIANKFTAKLKFENKDYKILEFKKC